MELSAALTRAIDPDPPDGGAYRHFRRCRGETPSRLEDYIVAKLIDVPEIDYDAHADILYDLAGQVVAHFRAKHTDDEQVRSILQGHARQIAEALVVQMKRHMWREQTNYRVTRVSAFDQLKPQTFDGSGKMRCATIATRPNASAT